MKNNKTLNHWQVLSNHILDGEYTFNVCPPGVVDRPVHPKRVFGSGQIREMLLAAENVAKKRYKEDAIDLFACFGTGTTTGEVVVCDFANEVRQLLISGVQGSGKSNALTFIILSMMWGNHPRTVDFHLFDLKHELSFFKGLCGVEDTTRGIEEGMEGLRKNMYEQYKNIQRGGYRNIKEWNESLQKHGKNPLKRHVIVIDEYANAAFQIEKLNGMVTEICNMGRAAGYYIIVSTQRADRESISPKIKSNMTGNLAFRVRGEVNARIAGLDAAKNIKEVGVAATDVCPKNDFVRFPRISIGQLKYAINALKTLN